MLKSKILSSTKHSVLGDISIGKDLTMSRSEAERIVTHPFYIDTITETERTSYIKAVCVIHINSSISCRGGRDVDWCYDDCSLFQKIDGSFFIAICWIADFSGSERIVTELNKNYFETHEPNDFIDLLIKCRLIDKNASEKVLNSEDFISLFKKRTVTFYAQEYLNQNYQILFYNSKGRLEYIKKFFEEYEMDFNLSPDKIVLLDHLQNQYNIALELIKSKKWVELS